MKTLIESVLAVAQQLSVAGIAIVAVVLLLVAFLKQFNKKDGTPWLTGNALLLVGFAIGFIAAVLTYLANHTPPVDADWYTWFGYCFVGLLYGVLVGVLPSGTYELVFKQLANNANSTAASE